MRSPGPSLAILLFFASLISLLAPTIASAAVAGVSTHDPEPDTQDGFPTPIATTLTQVPTTVAGPLSLVVPISPNLTDANARADGDCPTPTGSEVTRFNMFWPLLTFILAYSTHPLNGLIEMRPAIQAHVLMSPAGPVFGLLYLFCDILYPPIRYCSYILPPDGLQGTWNHLISQPSFRQAIHMAVHKRLKRSLPTLILPGPHNRDCEPSTERWIGRKITLRLFLTAFSVLQFIKICAYRGTGLGFVWIIMVFVPWLVLELLFLTFNENCGLSNDSRACIWQTELRWVPSVGKRKKRFIDRAFLFTMQAISLISLVDLVKSIETLRTFSLGDKGSFLPILIKSSVLMFSVVLLVAFSNAYLSPTRILPSRIANNDITLLISVTFFISPVLLWFFLVYDLSGSSKLPWAEELP